MSDTYPATIIWAGNTLDPAYPKVSTLTKPEGKASIPVSGVPLYGGDGACWNPEDMLAGALANCHMLTFLHRARLAGFLAVRYEDAAEGIMAEIAPKRMAVTKVWLRPVVTWEGRAPTEAELERLHHEAHEECFIANSVTTKVVIAAPAAA